jgi:hypothetical protein
VENGPVETSVEAHGPEGVLSKTVIYFVVKCAC